MQFRRALFLSSDGTTHQGVSSVSVCSNMISLAEPYSFHLSRAARSIEEHDFAGRRQPGNVALKIPFRVFTLGRFAERFDAHDARVGACCNAFDGAALARAVTAFEQDGDANTFYADPLLKLDEFNL